MSGGPSRSEGSPCACTGKKKGRTASKKYGTQGGGAVTADKDGQEKIRVC